MKRNRTPIRARIKRTHAMRRWAKEINGVLRNVYSKILPEKYLVQLLGK